MSNIEEQEVQVDEQVVLRKYDGEALPENEVERLVILNGEVIQHVTVENGEPSGPVQENSLEGKDIGRLFPNTEKEV